jgi:hypothetical protein
MVHCNCTGLTSDTPVPPFHMSPSISLMQTAAVAAAAVPAAVAVQVLLTLSSLAAGQAVQVQQGPALQPQAGALWPNYASIQPTGTAVHPAQLALCTQSRLPYVGCAACAGCVCRLRVLPCVPLCASSTGICSVQVHVCVAQGGCSRIISTSSTSADTCCTACLCCEVAASPAVFIESGSCVPKVESYVCAALLVG